jgi:hypothetical protein
MVRISDIKEHMEVIGADGVHVGTVDKVEGNRIKLTKADSGEGSHKGHHHFLSTGLVADVEGNKVRLSATGANAFMFREEGDEGSAGLVTGGTSTGSHASPQPARSQSAHAQPDRSQSGSKTNWTGIALGGAAATAAAIGATLFARSRKTETKTFQLQLQTDENLRLISSSKVEGTAVVGTNGERLGRIENFMVDKYSGRVAYAVLSFGGTFGVGESLFPLPWSYLVYDEDHDGYVLDMTKEELAGVPNFKPSDAPEFSLDYRQNIAQAYGSGRY